MLQSMGQDPSDEELFDMIAAVDDDGSGEIDFEKFCMVIANQKAATAAQSDERHARRFHGLGRGYRSKEGEVVKDDEGKIKEPKGGAVRPTSCGTSSRSLTCGRHRPADCGGGHR